MSDDIVMHSVSNSSDPTLPSKLAKLEARMVGKSSSSPSMQAGWQPAPAAKYGGLEEFQSSTLSRDSDDDNGGAYLIQRNFQKHQSALEDEHVLVQSEQLKVISDLLVSISKIKRQEARMKIRQESLRLGYFSIIREGTIISETWEDGEVLKDINAQMKSLLERKEDIDSYRKSLKKWQSDKCDGSDIETGMSEEDFLIQDEICKTRLARIKREEEKFLRERDRYELEKARLIREMKRVRDEDGSRFNNFQVLNQRYALLNLLGKDDFSEVYKAFDLVENRFVTCKIHGLDVLWSEEKKQSFLRHAVRECNIRRTLAHPHNLQLWDIFEIDQKTFCIVYEDCSGKDIDAVLKATTVITKEEVCWLMSLD